jgi:PAS domain S-box-containing protein
MNKDDSLAQPADEGNQELRLPEEIKLPQDIEPQQAEPQTQEQGEPSQEKELPPEEIKPEDLIKSLNVAISHCSMYPPQHPLVKEVLSYLHQLYNKFLKDRDEDSLNFGMVENKLLLQKEILDDTNPLVSRFSAYFKRLGIDSLTLLPEITPEELGVLSRIMGMRQDAIEAKGGIEKLLERQACPHIKLERFRYERLGDGQTIVSTEEGQEAITVPRGQRVRAGTGQEAQARVEQKKARKESFYKIITRYLKGEVEDLSLEADEEELLKEITKNPRRSVTLIVQVGREIKNLQLAMERFGDWLVRLAAEKGASLKQDLSELLSSLGKMLQEELLGPGATQDSIQVADSLGVVVSRYSDKIKLQMIMSKYSSLKRKSPAAVEKMVCRFIKTRQEKERLLPQLTRRLRESGLKDDKLDELLGRIEKKPFKEEQVTISRSELRRLYELEERLKVARDQLQRPSRGTTPALASSQARVTEEKREPAPPGKSSASEDELRRLREKVASFESLLAQKIEEATAPLKRSNEEISLDLERLNTIVRRVAAGIIIVDNQDRVLSMNRAAEELLGLSREEVIGRHILENIKEEHLVALARRQSLKEDRVVSGVELSSPDERTRETLRASSAAVEDEDGKTVGMVFVLTDIAKQKELERLKESFISRVSANIRDPIVGLQDSLALVLNRTAGELNPEQQRLLEMVRENAERLDYALQELVDIAAIEAEGLKLKPTLFDARGLVQEVISGFERWAKEKNIYLKAELPAGPIQVYAHSERVASVLSNLIANAIRATGQGGVTVTLGPQWDDQGRPSGLVLFSVEDTGRGIPSSELDKVFQPFIQLGPGAPAEGRLGLGLAIAKETIQAQGGKIWVESTWGKGSKFSFALPGPEKASSAGLKGD